MSNRNPEIVYFKFEDDFVNANVRCIPMIVRFNLDACGIKLKLTEWRRFSLEERANLVTLDCTDRDAVAQYGQRLRRLVIERTGTRATEIPVVDHPEWARTDSIPPSVESKLIETRGSSISLEQWKQLGDLRRFALLKLSRPGHENKNFPNAVEEFGLLKNGR